MISDFKPTTAPGDDFKVIQFVDSTCIIISVLCEQSKILVISDFKPTTAPGDDFKVIQFVDSTTGKQG